MLTIPHCPPSLHAAQCVDGFVPCGLLGSFRIRESHSLQFKVSAFHLSNTPLFGLVPITRINSPRSIELGFRYVF
jgi:hypothetical protein